MPQTEPQRRATAQVAKWLALNERNNAWLAETAGIDPGTVGDFLNEQRWPKNTTLGKIDAALGWQVGTIRQLAAGAQVDIVWGEAAGIGLDRSVGGDAHDADDRSYVSAPGERVEQRITNEDLLREILRSRAEYDQIRAAVRDLSGRVDRLEQPDP